VSLRLSIARRCAWAPAIVPRLSLLDLMGLGAAILVQGCARKMRRLSAQRWRQIMPIVVVTTASSPSRWRSSSSASIYRSCSWFGIGALAARDIKIWELFFVGLVLIALSYAISFSGSA